MFHKVGPWTHWRYLALRDGERVEALQVLASAADEPDYGHDINLFSDNPGDTGQRYNFGPQPFGDARFEYSSQAPFHIGYYHESALIFAAAPYLGQTLPHWRVYQYSGLARLAFASGHPYWGYRFLGWAMHYLQDLTQPYHASVLPGVGTSGMVLIAAKAEAGYPEDREAAIQRVADRHTAIEQYQFDRMQALILADALDHPLLAAYGERQQDADYPPFDVDYAAQVVAAESHARADPFDALIGEWMARVATHKVAAGKGFSESNRATAGDARSGAGAAAGRAVPPLRRAQSQRPERHLAGQLGVIPQLAPLQWRVRWQQRVVEFDDAPLVQPGAPEVVGVVLLEQAVEEPSASASSSPWRTVSASCGFCGEKRIQRGGVVQDQVAVQCQVVNVHVLQLGVGFQHGSRKVVEALGAQHQEQAVIAGAGFHRQALVPQDGGVRPVVALAGAQPAQVVERAHVAQQLRPISAQQGDAPAVQALVRGIRTGSRRCSRSMLVMVHTTSTASPRSRLIGARCCSMWYSDGSRRRSLAALSSASCNGPAGKADGIRRRPARGGNA